jgi:hypothetical protein
MIAWLLLGVGVAYLFGRFVQRVEISEDAGELAPPVVRYLRHAKRAKASSRAATHAATHTKARRVASNGRR